ncbi:hypothetical protein D3C76_1472220 [compost metagenome]
MRIVAAESLAVPQVDTGLVLQFDVDVEVVEQLAAGLDDLVFGFPGQVWVEVEDVVVLYAPIQGALGLLVPDGLEQAAGGEHALVQAECG